MNDATKKVAVSADPISAQTPKDLELMLAASAAKAAAELTEPAQAAEADAGPQR